MRMSRKTAAAGRLFGWTLYQLWRQSRESWQTGRFGWRTARWGWSARGRSRRAVARGFSRASAGANVVTKVSSGAVPLATVEGGFATAGRPFAKLR